MVAAATASHGYITFEVIFIKLLHLNMVKLMHMLSFAQILRLVEYSIRGQQTQNQQICNNRNNLLSELVKMKSKCLLFLRPQCAANGRIGLTLSLPFPQFGDIGMTMMLRGSGTGESRASRPVRRGKGTSAMLPIRRHYANAVVAACNEGLEVPLSVPYKAID